MKKYILLLFLFMLAQMAYAQTLGANYRLKKVIEVAGRQGVAADANYYYVSCSKVLYKYNKNGDLVMKNDNPFVSLAKPANHFGDIDVWNGEIYTGVEIFDFGVSKNIQIAVFDAATLAYKFSIPWEPQSGQTEVCGLAVDRARNTVWMADWTRGQYLYSYNLATKKYDGKIHLRPNPQCAQGIFCANGKMLISADDGDADFDETDNIYICDISNPNATATYVSLFREMKEFRRAGEIEGLCIDPSNGDLLVLSNRGTRVDRGMPVGFYDGYDKEIHELYIFEKVK